MNPKEKELAVIETMLEIADAPVTDSRPTIPNRKVLSNVEVIGVTLIDPGDVEKIITKLETLCVISDLCPEEPCGIFSFRTEDLEKYRDKLLVNKNGEQVKKVEVDKVGQEIAHGNLEFTIVDGDTRNFRNNGISLNVSKKGLRREDLIVIENLIKAKGGQVASGLLIERMGGEDNGENNAKLHRSIYRLRTSGKISNIKNHRSVGYYLA